MCEHHDQLRRAQFELERMWGDGIIDYPKLRSILNEALEHQEGHHV